MAEGKSGEGAVARLFAQALKEAMSRAEMTQAEVSERTDGLVKQNTISEWVSGVKLPLKPAAVFAVERALSLPPGALSGYLGYLPNEVYRVSVETAIAVDDRIDPRLRESLLDALSRFRPAKGERGNGG